jgi:hypothetical protein
MKQAPGAEKINIQPRDPLEKGLHCVFPCSRNSHIPYELVCKRYSLLMSLKPEPAGSMRAAYSRSLFNL